MFPWSQGWIPRNKQLPNRQQSKCEHCIRRLQVKEKIRIYAIQDLAFLNYRLFPGPRQIIHPSRMIIQMYNNCIGLSLGGRVHHQREMDSQPSLFRAERTVSLTGTINFSSAAINAFPHAPPGENSPARRRISSLCKGSTGKTIQFTNNLQYQFATGALYNAINFP